MNISVRIQTLRKNRGISQEELADKIGVSRQAVSKWESEQSTPDIDKIILLSNYFDVTTDYLLKGVEPTADVPKNENDARIFSVVGTALNFIGLVAAIMVWKEEQTPVSVAIGLIIMALGCMIFAVGQYIGSNKRAASMLFWPINIWILSLIPISCLFNSIQGFVADHWWTFTPIPQLGNSIRAYVMCWVVYFFVSIVFDIVILKRSKQ